MHIRITATQTFSAMAMAMARFGLREEDFIACLGPALPPSPPPSNANAPLHYLPNPSQTFSQPYAYAEPPVGDSFPWRPIENESGLSFEAEAMHEPCPSHPSPSKKKTTAFKRAARDAALSACRAEVETVVRKYIRQLGYADTFKAPAASLFKCDVLNLLERKNTVTKSNVWRNYLQFLKTTMTDCCSPTHVN